MIIAIDVGYVDLPRGTAGLCATVGFNSWTDESAAIELTLWVEPVAPYVSGRFFERELPCVIGGVRAFEKETGESPDLVVVDGNVRLDRSGRPGLGAHVFDALGKSTPVIGVAKQPFHGLDAVEVPRGRSSKPLFVTAVGIDEQAAAASVAGMAGAFRVPTLLRRVDQLTRSQSAPPR